MKSAIGWELTGKYYTIPTTMFLVLDFFLNPLLISLGKNSMSQPIFGADEIEFIFGFCIYCIVLFNTFLIVPLFHNPNQHILHLRVCM